MFGYKPQELLGKQLLSLLPASKSLKTVTDHVTSSDTTPYEAMVLRKDGTSFQIEIQTRMMVYRGRTVRVVACKDISELKMANEQLYEAIQKYRRLFEAVPHGIQEIDTEGNILSANSANHKMLGYEKGELIGKNIAVILHEEERDRLFSDLKTFAIQQQQPIPFVGRNYTKNGQVITIEAAWDYKLNNKGVVDGFVSIITDITERKQAEAALLESEEQLRQAQKMESIGRLAGGVAHDFNNLLTTIIGYSELISMEEDLTNTTIEGVQEIKNSAERAAALTQQLLAFSRKQVLQPQVIDLNRLITKRQAKKSGQRLLFLFRRRVIFSGSIPTITASF